VDVVSAKTYKTKSVLIFYFLDKFTQPKHKLNWQIVDPPIN